MTDILDDLKDLHKQATEERSHYYTGSVVLRAITEIEMLRNALLTLAVNLPSSIDNPPTGTIR